MKNNTKNPMVAVIIPTFNQGWCITEAVESISNQNYPNIEIIIIDDGSTDNTAKKFSPYLDRITYIKQKNKGVNAEKNYNYNYIDWLSENIRQLSKIFRKMSDIFRQILFKVPGQTGTFYRGKVDRVTVYFEAAGQ